MSQTVTTWRRSALFHALVLAAAVSAAAADQTLTITSFDCAFGCVGYNADPALSGVNPQTHYCTFVDPLPGFTTAKRLRIVREGGKALFYTWAGTPTVSVEFNGAAVGTPQTIGGVALCGGLFPIEFDTGLQTNGLDSYIYGGTNTIAWTVANGDLNLGTMSVEITYDDTPRTLTLQALAPDIPTGSGLVNDCLEYRSKLLLTAVRDPIKFPGISIALAPTRPQFDTFDQPPATDSTGSTTGWMFTRDQGTGGVTATSKGFRPALGSVTFAEANFESGFLVTAYATALESDFSGPSVTNPCGLTGTFNEAFLTSNRGVLMEGSGQDSAGDVISIDYAQTPNPSKKKVCFKIDSCSHTASNTCATAGRTVAIDPDVMEYTTIMRINGVSGNRTAEDTGGAITGYHIDNYVGAGKAAIKAWNNLKGAVVRYIDGGGQCTN